MLITIETRYDSGGSVYAIMQSQRYRCYQSTRGKRASVVGWPQAWRTLFWRAFQSDQTGVAPQFAPKKSWIQLKSFGWEPQNATRLGLLSRERGRGNEDGTRGLCCGMTTSDWPEFESTFVVPGNKTLCIYCLRILPRFSCVQRLQCLTCITLTEKKKVSINLSKDYQVSVAIITQGYLLRYPWQHRSRGCCFTKALRLSSFSATSGQVSVLIPGVSCKNWPYIFFALSLRI